MDKLIILIIIGLIIVYYLDKSEIVENHYSTYLNLVESGDLEHGWIDNIPKSSFDIIEYHDIDSNEVWLSFTYLNFSDVLSGCKKVKNQLSDYLPKNFPNSRWKSDFLDDFNHKSFYICKEKLVSIIHHNQSYYTMQYRYSR